LHVQATPHHPGAIVDFFPMCAVLFSPRSLSAFRSITGDCCCSPFFPEFLPLQIPWPCCPFPRVPTHVYWTVPTELDIPRSPPSKPARSRGIAFFLNISFFVVSPFRKCGDGRLWILRKPPLFILDWIPTGLYFHLMSWGLPAVLFL